MAIDTAYRRTTRRRPLGERFHEKVDRSGDCWLWMANRNNLGYGLISDGSGRGSRKLFAHRVAWEQEHGPIGQGLLVCHHCDTPACVRPSHLFLGTIEDNMRDRNAKGRQARGERAGRAKLTIAKVTEMRSLRGSGVTQVALADRFGVSRTAVRAVINGRSWSDGGWSPSR